MRGCGGRSKVRSVQGKPIVSNEGGTSCIRSPITRLAIPRTHTWRLLGLLTTVALALGVNTATASAAVKMCVGGAGAPVVAPNSDGTCKKPATLKTLADQADVTVLQTKVGTLESKVGTLESQVSTLESKVSTLESESGGGGGDVSALEAKVSALESKLSKVSYDPAGLNGLPTLKISGANLQIVNGSGNTAGALNGLGNLFIGYNEPEGGEQQSGSHNLVMGFSNDFTSYGGIVAGYNNVISGQLASVLGGSFNTASGDYSVVSGGGSNTASGDRSSVSGGSANEASAIRFGGERRLCGHGQRRLCLSERRG